MLKQRAPDWTTMPMHNLSPVLFEDTRVAQAVVEGTIFWAAAAAAELF